MNTLKTGILFLDWDGTLSHGRFWSGLDQERYQKIQQYLFGQNGSLVDEWMKGSVSSEDICAWLERSTGYASRDLLDVLIQSCEQMVLREILTHLISETRKERYVFLITDNMDCFSRFTVPALQLRELFDGIVNSSDVKRGKRDQNGLSFQEIAGRHTIPLKECILIDDSQQTCSLFHGIGGHAYQALGVQHTAELLKTIVDKNFPHQSV